MGAFNIAVLSILSALLMTAPQAFTRPGPELQAVRSASAEEVTLTLTTSETTSPCRDKANPVGCTTLLVTLQNDLRYAIRSGQKNCGARPILLEQQTPSGSWTSLPKRELEWDCTRNFMEWTTIEPGARITVPIHLEDEQFLDLPALQKSIGATGSLTMRAHWNIYGCPAAIKEPSPSPQAASATSNPTNNPQCASAESPQQNYLELTSNTITLHSK